MSTFTFLSPFLRRATPNAAPWTCRACLRRQTVPQQHGFATKSSTLPKPPKNKRKRRIIWTAGGLGIGIAAVTVNDEAKHALMAVQRSSRVVSTLAVCIYDYRDTLKRDQEPDYDVLLKACHKRCAQRTLVTLEKNGSIFIKLGQHLSSLTYILPTEWCDTFIPLQDKCPISSYESIEEMVLKDTGRGISEYFSEFEETPIGAASLAQVHRAVIKETGQKVAVKVQHPALDEWAKLDLALTRFTFETLKKWFPELIEDALATGAVAVAVASHTLVHFIVVDLSIQHRLDASLEAEFGVIDLSARLDELGHAHAEDVDGLLLRHHVD